MGRRPLKLGQGGAIAGAERISSGNRWIADWGRGPNVQEAPTEQRARQPNGSHEHFHYRPRFPNDLAHPPKLRKGFACILPMFERILIATRSA
jgi:hypothetical protein